MTLTTTKLQEFCRIVQGGRHGLSGNDFVADGFPAYGAGGINGHLASYEFDEPAVVLSAIGARCGKCFYATGKWSSLANTQVILPDPSRADARFMWYQLNDERRWHRSGTGQPFIKPLDVKVHRVHLPPLAEQRRTAALLDQADGLRAKRRTALAQLDTLTQSIFLGMFGDPNAKGAGLRVAPLEEVCSFLAGFAWRSERFSKEPVGLPIVRIQNVDAVKEVEFVYWPDSYDPRFVVRRGDMLLTLSGSFRVAEWTGPEALLNQRIVRVEPKPAIERPWLLHAIRLLVEKIEALGRHALVNNVAISDLKQLTN